MTPAKAIKNLQKGFTLIELLVVIGILAILLAIVLIAINPAKQFGQANDTKRRSDVNAILNAIDQYMADNKGVPPAGIPVSPVAAKHIADAASGGVELCTVLTTKYLAALPADPTAGTPVTGQVAQPCPAVYDTGYTVQASSADNRITVAAPTTYDPAAVISVTR